MKEETLEEAAKIAWQDYEHEEGNLYSTTFRGGFIAGAKWQAEQIPNLIEQYLETAFISNQSGYMNPKEWFEQFKKK